MPHQLSLLPTKIIGFGKSLMDRNPHNPKSDLDIFDIIMISLSPLFPLNVTSLEVNPWFHH